jgi:hypothetical protein
VSVRIVTLVLVALITIAATAKAQVPSPDSVPSFERPNGALLRPGVLTYTLTLTAPTGQTTSLGTHVVSVTETTLGGTAGWLIDDARRGTAVETSDSVYVQRADLAPERWTATIGRAQMGASFTRDTMFGALDTYRGRAAFTLAVPPGALLSAGMTARLLELLPLRTGYRVSASLVLLDGEGAHARPAEIVVDREERITVSGRSFECWVVALRAGALEQRFWVAKAGSRVVRTEQAVAEGLLTAVLQP